MIEWRRLARRPLLLLPVLLGLLLLAHRPRGGWGIGAGRQVPGQRGTGDAAGFYSLQLHARGAAVTGVGVLYHLRYPLYALDKVARLPREKLVFQSMLRGVSGTIPLQDDPGSRG